MEYIAYGKTDVGKKRENNEDAFFTTDREGLFLVADGMGGHKSGEVASAINVMSRALDAFEAANDKRKTQAERWLRDLAKRARKAGLLMGGGGET